MDVDRISFAAHRYVCWLFKPSALQVSQHSMQGATWNCSKVFNSSLAPLHSSKQKNGSRLLKQQLPATVLPQQQKQRIWSIP